MDIRRFTTAVGKYLINPIVKAAIALGLAPRELPDPRDDRAAHALPHDDPRQRLRKIGLRFNGAVVQIMGTKLLTIQIDLDP